MSDRIQACDQSEYVTSYAVGELEGEAMEAFEKHLACCKSCSEELRAMSPALEALLDATPEVAPPPSLWDELQRRIHDDPETSADGRDAESGDEPEPPTSPGLRFISQAASEFQPFGAPGVSFRLLNVDREAGRISAVVRIEPGSFIPAHDHKGLEECWVISGDVWVGDTEMGAGDYQVGDAGSHHPAHSTKGGCVLLISASTEDYPQF